MPEKTDSRFDPALKARVSSVGQSLDVQCERLTSCDKLFEEKRSGATDARPQLNERLNYVSDSDQLIVNRIDRLARSTHHLCQIAETLRQRGSLIVSGKPKTLMRKPYSALSRNRPLNGEWCLVDG
ncbi:recombinase family protein [Ruegeria atlantica]|uniref:recombinase family protein n=1 Tax=Ruegeria atlantica TaxID=81569 RepID=UPI0024950C37|nr:recombinase family protein [Ruegeria atlantica]